jgi:hypothetical protein
MFGSGKTEVEMYMGSSGVSFTHKDEGTHHLKMYANGPGIELEDEQGFQTNIGRTDLEMVKTGESRKTSAASIVTLATIQVITVILR